ncbi:hypothetical protein HW555_008835 [Spodoptera exigua]|uniref:Uncharacterized protein n=1 Tax=Spodoptera exigua TaxID=7107 RepID=A0A835L438_SPOEX|nr:hypothetical protein HW555_008835 [Spodoptera exigua]
MKSAGSCRDKSPLGVPAIEYCMLNNRQPMQNTLYNSILRPCRTIYQAVNAVLYLGALYILD